MQRTQQMTVSWRAVSMLRPVAARLQPDSQGAGVQGAKRRSMVTTMATLIVAVRGASCQGVRRKPTSNVKQ